VRADRIAAAALVATIAFWAYTQTLLPGVDLGDTGGFQAAVLWPATSARQAYPLYYDLAKPFVGTLSRANPARGLNLFSAVWGGIAVGLLTWIVAAVGESLLAGAAAGLLLAFSYTFWSQAIIAEVYTLHLALVGVCLIALYWFAQRESPPGIDRTVGPRRLRLAIFFACYALAFGNHLSMVLLLVPFTTFLLLSHPRPRELFRPSVVAMALGIAALGALQYLPNVMAVGSGIDGPQTIAERLADFWFDATKADWRETMVLGVGGSQLIDRLQMMAWDARQQFGLFGLALAGIGAVRIWFRSRAWAALTWTAYAINATFAFTYNVGDTHVFFLPAHYFAAFFAGVAVLPVARLGRFKAAPAIVLLVFAIWRGWDTWPAIDRHADRRGEQLAARVGAGIDDQQAVLISDMNWQAENALLYASRWERPGLVWTRMPELLLHFPFFVADNQAIGRDLVMTADAAAEMVAAYGPLFPVVRDDTVAAPPLRDLVAAIPRGSMYVLCLLAPPRDEPFDAADFDAAVNVLTGARGPSRQNAGYEVWAGLAGEPPWWHHAASRPFRARVSLLGEAFDIRMESWLSTDTFRRAGFGQVIRGRDHALIVERGVSLLWFGQRGDAHVAYAAGLYAPRPRYRIPAAMMSLAALPYRAR
jgi:hypothetical protein